MAEPLHHNRHDIIGVAAGAALVFLLVVLIVGGGHHSQPSVSSSGRPMQADQGR